MMPRNRPESGFADVIYIVALGVTVLAPVIVLGIFAITTTWGRLTHPAPPAQPPQCVDQAQRETPPTACAHPAPRPPPVPGTPKAQEASSASHRLRF